jgi:DNA recombination-dependent growth factor C|tara:strand:+ start:389 stop:595 length:207 start_codon:yes stop_codon:yes gene_type:complete
MNPEDIELRSTSQQFEYEKMSRDIDKCDDVEVLREMCKFLVKLEMKTRENYSIILQDTLPDISKNGIN